MIRYVGVGDEEDVQVFYYFESGNNPKEDPLMLWLTGDLVALSFLALCMK
jgi:carboxypeptidase C (cathepsin A)